MMLEEAKQRTLNFQRRMREAEIVKAVFTDESSIAYLAGFWGYLGIEFGRPTLLIVHADDAPTVITPLLEHEMVSAMTWVDDVRSWEEIGGKSWRKVTADVLGKNLSVIYVEHMSIPSLVRHFLADCYPGVPHADISPVLGAMRMIKSPEEIAVMRQTGEIAVAMMKAAEESLAPGIPEYETALAVIHAGTRKAAEFLKAEGWEEFVSPMIHNLQIMQSGRATSMVHRRAGLKKYRHGDPVYLCFCNMAQFKMYKLGFDRMFFINEVSDEAAEIQETAIEAQQAAVKAIRPGVKAEDVAEAANVVYRRHGFEAGYRTGRSIGMAYLESPELKLNDKTVLKPGMTFAVDGGISVEGRLGGRIGDSVAVTKSGFEYLTEYSRDLLVV